MNGLGQLGDGGTTYYRSTPVAVSGLSNIIAVAGGVYHSLALSSDGRVYAWGYNGYGQLGDGGTTNRSTPVAVSGLSNIIAVAGGVYHSLALSSDGGVYAWGMNGLGQLGDGTVADRAAPRRRSDRVDDRFRFLRQHIVGRDGQSELRGGKSAR